MENFENMQSDLSEEVNNILNSYDADSFHFDIPDIPDIPIESELTQENLSKLQSFMKLSPDSQFDYLYKELPFWYFGSYDDVWAQQELYTKNFWFKDTLWIHFNIPDKNWQRNHIIYKDGWKYFLGENWKKGTNFGIDTKKELTKQELSKELVKLYKNYLLRQQ